LLTSFRKIKLKTVQRAFWLVLLGAFLLGATMQVAAQINPDADETYRTKPIPPTPATQSILGFLNQDELSTIISPEYQQDCADLDSLAVGLIPTATWDGFGNLLVADPVESACAVTAFNNGNPRLLAEMLNRGNDGSLLSSVFALGGKILDQRPASGASFVEDKVYALSNIGTVNAQEGPPGLYYRGTGFDLLRPIQSFWGWSVNIVYALLIFVIVIVAFGIMFRANLSGNLAVTLQSAIPNIALAMILVPLSYAITGLFIDGITVGVNVTHQFLIGPGSPGRDVYESRNEDFGTDVGPFGEIEDRGLHADDMRVSWLFSGYNLVSGNNSLGEGLEDLSGGVGLIFGIAGFLEFLSIGSWLIPIVNFLLGVLLLLTGLRIFAKLLLKYLTFIIMPLVAPFVFAAIALPGSGMKIIMWYVRMMGAATLSFVAAYAMILLSLVFSSSSFIAQLPDVGVTTFVPPLTGIESVLTSFASGANAGGATSLLAFMFILVAFALYMLIPKTLDNIDEALGVDKSLPKLVTDVFQSTKDSIGLGRAGIKAGIGASRLPGQAAKGVQTARSLNRRGGQTIRNLYDRGIGVNIPLIGNVGIGRGVNVGGAGSDLAKRRADLGSQISQTQRELRNAISSGNKGAARNAQNRLTGLKARMDDLNASGAIDEQHKEAKEVKMSLEVSFNGQAGPINLTQDKIEELMQAGNGPAQLRQGKVKLKVEGEAMSPDFLRRLAVVPLKPGDVSKLRSDQQLDFTRAIVNFGDLDNPNPLVSISRLLAQLNAAGGWQFIGNTGGARITFSGGVPSPAGGTDPTAAFATATGDGFEFGFGIEIPDSAAFLGAINPLGVIKTDKYRFVIGDPRFDKEDYNWQSNEADIMVISSFSQRPTEVSVV
jgi:hypothetical protein